MSNIKKFLGLDYGLARIGVAIGDSETRLATPLTTLIEAADAVRAVDQLVREHEVDLLVVGLPRSLDGADTAQTFAARDFAQALLAEGHQIIMQDEAGTTDIAKERLHRAKKPFKRTDVDMLAAVLILQDYLDSL